MWHYLFMYSLILHSGKLTQQGQTDPLKMYIFPIENGGLPLLC